jgi:hypothetical protein
LLPDKKSSTEYGCDFVYHSVREDVFLRTTGTEPFSGSKLFRAPLYGGPSMLDSENSEVLAYYECFTEKTLFLVDESLAEKTLLGRVAAVRSQMGKGKLYLFGPHFEHPLFLQANNYIAKTIFWEKPNGTNPTLSISDLFIEGTQKEKFVRDLKRQISNSRIVAVGLEESPVEWTIGCKIYRPEKIRVFLDAIWKRIKIMEKFHKIAIFSVSVEETVQLATRVTHFLRQIKIYLDNQLDTSDLAENLFDSLRNLTIGFLQVYFPSFKINPEYDSCVVRK